MPKASAITPKALERRWRYIDGSPESSETLLDAQTSQQMERYQCNIENFIGTVKVPLGVAGPLRINGKFASGDYFVPLATTEATLVASYHRGALLISEVGGCTAMLVEEGIGRTPGFIFRDLVEVEAFVNWTATQLDFFRDVAKSTTRYGSLSDMRATVEGNHVYLSLQFLTGDAVGQNMVTIATEAICAYIAENTPVMPRESFVEANLSGDKKASAQTLASVRGKKVVAEVTLPADLVTKRLHTSPERMAECWQMGALGGVMSGTIGAQGHYANGLAALYVACGQDIACVAESAIGVTRMDVTDGGALYAAVTLPGLMLGTVGGGTGLPSQRACLDIMGLAGPNKAKALAEVCAGLVLAGELSITGAISAGHFARAHLRLARGKADNTGSSTADD
jgi:hydroxymethylglutaryl-CoA reductase (NADPH)